MCVCERDGLPDDAEGEKDNDRECKTYGGEEGERGEEDVESGAKGNEQSRLVGKRTRGRGRGRGRGRERGNGRGIARARARVRKQVCV